MDFSEIRNTESENQNQKSKIIPPEPKALSEARIAIGAS
jgi:hypothetical protein